MPTAPANAALKLLEVMENLEVSFPPEYGDRSWIESIPEIEVRIGLHCGAAAAGVVGENKFLYDLWGDAVNHRKQNGESWRSRENPCVG
jgi:class 3 adenylate cyclase